ncbi:protein OS-9 [Blastomyces parvus]|uniref:Endoplasmic reticulum lectin n=1 Tax=Blastomyces parvus TaxID=2060905 RepID=A0A2B7WM28_9EURO|nr:protein OS-9 [Blastomyces parvus]
MRQHSLLSLSSLLAYAALGLGSEKTFNVYDDVLAFPQFEVHFPLEYILAPDAQETLASQRSFSTQNAATTSPSPSSPPLDSSIVHLDRSQQQAPLQDEKKEEAKERPTFLEEGVERYEEMLLDGARYLCALPRVATINETEDAATTPAEREKELARAADRGLELLSDMEERCIYYVAGWWSYSFCYMDQVRQFHALPPGNGVPAYPPVEDPSTHSYVLGRFRGKKGNNKDGKGGSSSQSSSSSGGDKKSSTTEVAVLQAKGDSRYLVQHLEDGTVCDITGRNRKIEVQFHCHPQSTDRIGWIKEVSTCTYLMIIYTPRLCNDIAFQPPREDDPNPIVCREIIEPEDISEFEEAKALHKQAEEILNLGKSVDDILPIIGGIEVGAMKLVGKEGKRIEKGKVASAGDERVEIVARRLAGEIHKMSKEELKKFNLDADKIEEVKKHLEDIAGGKDWKLEMVESNGRSTLRGILVADDDEDEEPQGKDGGNNKKQGSGKGKRNQDDNGKEEGSEETYKEEL